MSQMMPLEGSIKNLKQEISPDRGREYTTQDKALELLKLWTGQDFGYDVAMWEAWIAVNGDNLSVSGRVSRKSRKSSNPDPSS